MQILLCGIPKLARQFPPSNHHSVLDYNVFEGFEVQAQSRYTLSRGEVIWAWGQNSQSKPGRGKFVPRPAFFFCIAGAFEMESTFFAKENRT